MSTLTTTLIVLVIAVLAGVGLYNLVQFRRNSPRSREAKRTREDAATASSIPGLQRTEPTLGTLDLPLHGENGELVDADPDSVPGELAQISDLEKVVPQHDSTDGAAAGNDGRSAAGSAAASTAAPLETGIVAGQAKGGASVASEGVTAAASPGHEASRAEPHVAAPAPAPVASATAATQAQAPSSLPPPILHGATDCIVEIRLPNPYPAERLLGLSQSLRRVGAKPVVFEGWYTEGGQGRWLPIAPGQPATAYSQIRVGVLLANRHGPLNAMEFSEFTNGLSTLIDQLQASATLPDMGTVLDKARALDDACIELDAQVGLNVDSSEPLSPTDLERLAREQRLVERGSNRYARLGPGGEVLFSVSQVEQPNRVTFLLDLPRAPAAHAPWDQLVECAKTTAVRLRGSLVDDEGRPLADSALEQIGVQLASRAEALELAGFPAGSPLALRLFN